jgi:hypothetical protein
MQGESVEAPDEQKKLEIMKWIFEFTGLTPLVELFRKWATSDGRELVWKVAERGEDTWPEEGGRLFVKDKKIILSAKAEQSAEKQKHALFHECIEAVIQWIKTGIVTDKLGAYEAQENHYLSMLITHHFYPLVSTYKDVGKKNVGPLLQVWDSIVNMHFHY